MTFSIFRNPTSVSAPYTRVHLEYLDGLRGLAALYVVLHHAWQFCIAWAPAGALPHWYLSLTRWLGFGRFGVSMFIVLSGYCLMLPVARSGTLRGGARQFFIRRARRILPPYYAALGLSLMLIALFPAFYRGVFFSHAFAPGVLLSHLLLLHNFFASAVEKIDPPMWSVAPEWQIYFFFPFLLLPIWRHFGIRVLIASAAVLGAVLGHFIAPSALHYLALFAFGMAAATVAASPRTLQIVVSAVLVVLAAGAILHGYVHQLTSSYPLLKGLWVQDYAAGAGAACLLLVLASLPAINPIRWLFQSRALVVLGSFSYSLYLTHYPLLWLVNSGMQYHGLSGRGSVLVLVVIGIPLSVAAAYLFHLAFERPFMGRPTPKTKRQAEVAAIVSPAP